MSVAYSPGRVRSPRVYRDPEHVAERLPLYAVDRIADQSTQWLGSARRKRPDTPAAEVAEELRVKSARDVPIRVERHRSNRRRCTDGNREGNDVAPPGIRHKFAPPGPALRERAEAVGGTLIVGPGPEGGLPMGPRQRRRGGESWQRQSRSLNWCKAPRQVYRSAAPTAPHAGAEDYLVRYPPGLRAQRHRDRPAHTSACARR